jgi:5-methylcytosine-specific restriction enzyme A
MHLQLNPLCVFCERKGKIAAASVADHVQPHHGDPQAFWFGALQSLCQPCHNGTKRQQENKGFSTDCDTSGWPIDPKHPVYGGRP